MSVVMVLEYRAKQDSIEELRDVFARHNPEIRTVDGIESLSFYQDEDDPTVFIEVGIWTSRQAHDDWAAAWREQSQDELRKVLTLLEGPPSRRYCRLLDV